LTLTKLGKKRANPTQFIPRTSKELRDHLDDYEALQQIFEMLFSWLSDVVGVYLFFSVNKIDLHLGH